MGWLADIDWENRPPEFGALRAAEGSAGIAMPVMEMVLPGAPKTAVLDLWIRLSSHPNILEAVTHSTTVRVRYAALNWARTSSYSAITLANWGIQLVDVFSVISEEVRAKDRGLFLCPLLKIDIGGHVRLAFPSAERSDVERRFPIELRRKWPAVEEEALVFAVGTLLRRLSGATDASMETIVDRATDDNQQRRIKSLGDLRSALLPMAERHAIRDGFRWRSFKLFEEGLGWLALGRARKALECLEDARAEASTLLIEEACDVAREQLGYPKEVRVPRQPLSRARMHSSAVPPPILGDIAPADAVALGQQLERERELKGALAAYMRATHDTPAILLGRARCHLAIDEVGQAIDYAQRVLAIDPTSLEAQAIAIRGLLRRKDFTQALTRATLFVQAHPKHGLAHYLRGKALFANGRIEDARDSFDRASHHDPQLLEAQLLRRECERALGNVRKSVGSQHAPTFDVPAHLAELRDVLISGDIAAAIEGLRAERYTRDADARLLLARFLAFDGRADAALPIYDELVATSHREEALVGKGNALLALGQHGAALAVFEQLPNHADALEGAARALDTLGRADEAADAYRKFIALATNSSELRVRLAHEWLARR